ncbi:MAG TPA: hypothetical protein VES73_17015 [Lamprocystis sp. (in: g-proteobacteria)]|nr:hypothetical protein [Lamprocystis sp. (in: g-proteobacteria)]
MSLAASSVVRWTVIAAGVVAYPLLAHYSTVTAATNTVPALGSAVSLMPLLAIMAWLAWRSRRRSVMLLLFAGICLLLWSHRATLEQHFSWVYFIQHAGANALLAAMFGITLTRGRQPLCTRCARAVRGSLTPEVVRYTRHVTLGWTLFFLGISVISTLLFLFGQIDAWSVFANFLSFPLILLMFLAEHLVRLRLLPQLERHTIMDSILAFQAHPKPLPGLPVRPH